LAQGGDAPRSVAPVVALSLAVTVVCTFPLFLTGALAVQMRQELGFSVAGLGVATALYRVAGAALAIPFGRLADRMGPSGAMRIAAALAAASALGIAVVADRFVTLCGFLMLSGGANALGQTGANLSLSRAVRVGRQGIAFGLKQSALPIATLLAGLTVPALALTVGWRWAFALGAALAVVVGVLTPPSRDARFRVTATSPNRSRRRLPLVVLALALLFSMMAATTLSTFTVDAAVAGGMRPGAAGLLLTVGSACAVIVRLVAGMLADRRGAGHLRVVAALVAFGSIGYLLMAVQQTWALSIGVVLAFGLGWGFNGLFWLAIVRLNRATPGTATGFVMPGGMLGGVFGPILFGLIVEWSGYPAAWLSAAAWGLVGAVVMLLGRRLVRADLRDR
jgi:MFS family permease